MCFYNFFLSNAFFKFLFMLLACYVVLFVLNFSSFLFELSKCHRPRIQNILLTILILFGFLYELFKS